MRFIELSGYFVDIERIIYITSVYKGNTDKIYYDVQIEFKDKPIQISNEKFSREDLLKTIDAYYESKK